CAGGRHFQQDRLVRAMLPVVLDGGRLALAHATLLIHHHQLQPQERAHLALEAVEVVLDPRRLQGLPFRLVAIAPLLNELDPLPAEPRSASLEWRIHERSLFVKGFWVLDWGFWIN